MPNRARGAADDPSTTGRVWTSPPERRRQPSRDFTGDSVLESVAEKSVLDWIRAGFEWARLAIREAGGSRSGEAAGGQRPRRQRRLERDADGRFGDRPIEFRGTSVRTPSASEIGLPRNWIGVPAVLSPSAAGRGSAKLTVARLSVRRAVMVPPIPESLPSHDQILAALQRLGLPGREALLYLELLERGPVPAPRLAHHVGVHRVHLYRLLDRMQSKGVVELSAERPRRYSAASLSSLGQSWIRNQRRQLAADTALIQWLIVALQPSAVGSYPRFQIYRTRTGWQARLQEMIQRAEREIAASVRLGDRLDSEPVWKRLRRTGRPRLQVRLLLDRRPGEWARPRAEPKTEAFEARVLSHDALRGIIVDRREALAFLRDPLDPDGRPTAAWSNDPGFVESQRLVFQSLWNSAPPGRGARNTLRHWSAREPPGHRGPPEDA